MAKEEAGEAREASAKEEPPRKDGAKGKKGGKKKDDPDADLSEEDLELKLSLELMVERIRCLLSCAACANADGIPHSVVV